MMPGFHSFFRNSITFKTIVGESKSTMLGMEAVWNETNLPTLWTNYNLQNIYHADKFGLRLQCLPEKSYQGLKQAVSEGLTAAHTFFCNLSNISK